MHNICFTISLFHASTCFEHHVLIVRKSKLYYTASGIVTPVGGRPVHGTATAMSQINPVRTSILFIGDLIDMRIKPTNAYKNI